MRPKFIVYCLAAICLIFGWRGATLTEDINKTLAENARQSESSIMEIGMCFDWYGVIIVDSVIKTSHGIISPSEMVEVVGLTMIFSFLVGTILILLFTSDQANTKNLYLKKAK